MLNKYLSIIIMYNMITTGTLSNFATLLEAEVLTTSLFQLCFKYHTPKFHLYSNQHRRQFLAIVDIIFEIHFYVLISYQLYQQVCTCKIIESYFFHHDDNRKNRIPRIYQQINHLLYC